jgi:mono/diheme cytochrome c family protein
MLGTNLRVAAVVIGTLALYTWVANAIPQVQSEVPKQLNIGSDASPEELVAAGLDLYNGAGGCTACHGSGTRAPNLLTDERGTGLIGARCATRESGKSCKDYLHEALVKPREFVAPGFDPIMPDVSKTLSPVQIWSLVAYLESLGGTVDVTGADLPSASESGGDEGGAAAGGGFANGSTDPMTMLRDGGCLGCHKVGDEGAEVGPDFTRIGARSSAAVLRQGIIDPDAKIATGFEAMKGIMPKGLGDQMTATQLETLVSFLASRK